MPASAIGPLAIRLIAEAGRTGARGVIFLAASELRAERIADVLRAFAPEIVVAALPAWDCLPYDRASPSREVMGRRMSALRQVAEHRDGPLVVAATAEAVLQRVPPRSVFSCCLALRPGDALDPERLGARLAAMGYILDDRIDEPGEVAIRGQVIDLFPAGGVTPYRLVMDDGTLAEIHRYDPLTQRTTALAKSLSVEPVSEVVTAAGGEAEAEPRFAGMEHWLPRYYPEIETLFDYLPNAEIVEEAPVAGRRAAFWEQVAEGFRDRERLHSARLDGEARRAPATPEALYLDEAEWTCRAGGKIRLLDIPDAEFPPVPRFVDLPRPQAGLRDFARGALAAGDRLVLAAATESDLALLIRVVQAGHENPVQRIESWSAAEQAEPGSALAIGVDLDRGFQSDRQDLAVVCAADLLGSRAESAATPVETVPPLFADLEFRLGDYVVHREHGVGRLRDLETIAAEAAEPQDVVRLDYAGDASLLVPVADLGQIWGYAARDADLRLDRLNSDNWTERRATVEAEIAKTARRLVAMARERQNATAPKLVPLQRAYERVVSRFRFVETPDQRGAIDDTLRDLASGRPMDRLVVGDVGFGKTEVALRAAATAALSGKQVALAAPTTVLVRQHVDTFRRRFANLGIEVGHLSRLVPAAEARAVKKKLAAGEIQIVIGTHALTGRGVRFKDLGLLIIDEEQRFGAAQKLALRALGKRAHVLTLTATPIPRTLRTALVGLQDLSLIATPPALRRPIRTFVGPFDAATFRAALAREHRRGGQSFVVVPRIQDIAPMRKRLAELAPELRVLVAHGKMPALEVDESLIDFAGGRGDVLLATNIVESGLDVPRANTMLVWRADRFGLAQLHQLRGRVGRGRAQAVCYLLTEPEHELDERTVRRLGTLQSFDRLGAGMALSAQDLDLRGGGDLVGAAQSGHVNLIGLGLYQHLLELALRAARGEPAEDWVPDLNFGAAGTLPADYVPEPQLRLDLYVRLARAAEPAEVDALEDELADRFGPPPESVDTLLLMARLRCRCRAAGVARIDAGPQGIALSFRDGRAPTQPSGTPAEGAVWKQGRLILSRACASPVDRLRAALDLLSDLPAWNASSSAGEPVG